MKNNHFGQRLAQALADKGYKSTRNTATGLEIMPIARAINVSPSMVLRYISGQATPRLDILEAMSKWLDVSLTWLRDGVEYAQIIEIPLFSWEQAHQWKPGLKSPHRYSASLPPQLINKALFALEIMNDASRPAFPPGTIIILDPEKTPKHGELVIAAEKDQKEAIFRVFLIDQNDRYLKSFNAEFPPKLIDKSTIIKGVFIAADHSKAKF